MKKIGQFEVKVADLNSGFTVTTPGVETVHATWDDVEKRLETYVQGLRKTARNL